MLTSTPLTPKQLTPHRTTPRAQPAMRSLDVEQAFGIARAIAARFGRNQQDAEDLAGEAIVGCLEAMQRFDAGMGTRPTTWAWHRMMGKTIDAVRREACHSIAPSVGLDVSELVSGSHPTGPLSAGVDVRAIVDRARGTLDTNDMVVINAIYKDGCTIAEVARRKRWTPSATRRRHVRALERLRSHAS